MQYFKVRYDVGFFNIGTVYLAACNRELAKARLRKPGHKTLYLVNLRALKRVTRQEYQKAKVTP